jgi:hypothetical protein
MYLKVTGALVMSSPREARAVFTGNDERLHHLGLFEVSAKLVQLVEPECETIGIRVTAQVSEVLHHHKHLIRLRVNEALILHYLAQNRRAAQASSVQTIHQRVPVPVESALGVTDQCIDKGIVAKSIESGPEGSTPHPGAYERLFIGL